MKTIDPHQSSNRLQYSNSILHLHRHERPTSVFQYSLTSRRLQGVETFGLINWRQYLLPKHRVMAAIDNFKIVAAKLERRMSSKEERKDFMSYVSRYNDEKGMSLQEIRLNSATIIGAGTGTTSTWLSTSVHSLTCNPHAYRKLVKELRDTFSSDEEITSDSVTQLPYLAAVMQEALRMHSPSPSATGRFVPEGGEVIDGRFVPAGTTVGVHQHAAYHQASNFHRPDDFCPERWLPAGRAKGSEFAGDKLGVVNPFSYGPRTCLGIK